MCKAELCRGGESVVFPIVGPASLPVFSQAGGSRMADVLRSMALAGAILLAVVVLIVIISRVTVNRGEASMKGLDKHH